jgi:hypothetical protein
LLQGLSEDQIARLDALLAVDAKAGRTPLTWLKDLPAAPKAEHLRELVDRLRTVHSLGLATNGADRVHPVRFRQFVREGRLIPAYAIFGPLWMGAAFPA